MRGPRVWVAAAFLFAAVACDQYDEPENVVVQGNEQTVAVPCGGEGEPACAER